MSDLQPEPGGGRRQRDAAVSARNNIKVAQQNIARIEAKQKRDKRKKRQKRDEASNSGGKKSTGRPKTNMEFPGDGRTLSVKIADGAATAQCTTAHDAFKNGTDEAILKLVETIGSGSDQKELQEMVKDLAAENMGSGRCAALYGDYTVKKATGGMIVDGGVVLGKGGDYPGGNGTDGTREGNNVDMGGLWVATYDDMFGCKRITETFTMVPKEEVELAILGAYDAKMYELLQRETFSRCIGLFWSLVHHYRGGESGPKNLLRLFQKVCNERDWAVIPGLAKRNGKK